MRVVEKETDTLSCCWQDLSWESSQRAAWWCRLFWHSVGRLWVLRSTSEAGVRMNLLRGAAAFLPLWRLLLPLNCKGGGQSLNCDFPVPFLANGNYLRGSPHCEYTADDCAQWEATAPFSQGKTILNTPSSNKAWFPGDLCPCLTVSTVLPCFPLSLDHFFTLKDQSKYMCSCLEWRKHTLSREALFWISNKYVFTE